MPDAAEPPEGPAADPATAALLEAMRAVLLPLARLALARGLPFQAGEALLKQAYVTAAGEVAADGAAAGRQVSRISTATGIHRREVARLLQAGNTAAPPPRSLAIEVFARWLAGSLPRTLPRQAPADSDAPSFDALARSVTRDVHPRSLLDDLLRLGLAVLDGDGDTVRLQGDAFVPRGDAARMLGFLGSNVGDHLSAAVSNVLDGTAPNFEQAILADELSTQSIATARALISRQWQLLFTTLVPALESLIAGDRAAGRPQDQVLRVGLYEFTRPAEPRAAASPAPRAPVAKRTRRTKTPKEST